MLATCRHLYFEERQGVSMSQLPADMSGMAEPATSAGTILISIVCARAYLCPCDCSDERRSGPGAVVLSDMGSMTCGHLCTSPVLCIHAQFSQTTQREVWPQKRSNLRDKRATGT